MEIVELDVPQLILAASGETDSSGTGSGSVGDDTEDLARAKRGTWGDLWN